MASSRTTQWAAVWFRKAAEQGEIFAQTSLGYLYGRGERVPKDLALAHMWLSLAAAQGQPVAKVALDRLASKMSSGQVAEAQRLAPRVEADEIAPSRATRVAVTSFRGHDRFRAGTDREG
jgi:uncharacterized protein